MDIFWQLLDLRSFPSLWYWLFMAVTWIVVIGRPLGVPYDMVEDARYDMQVQADTVTMARINARRFVRMMDARVMPLFVFTLLGGVGVLAFGYGVGFAQAVSFIAWPLVWVFVLAVRAAGRVDRTADPQAILRVLRWHRYIILAIASVCMVFSLLWGTVHNIMNYPFL